MRFVSFRAVRSLVPIAEALHRIGWRATVSWGVRGTSRGLCPIHRSTSPSSRAFQVQCATGMYRCWKCGSHGDVIQLWAEIHGVTLRDAAFMLISEFNLSLERLSDQS